MPKSAELTPMLRHYLEVKAGHPDALLLYRMGDFYELFFEDAQAAAPILEIALTARHKGTDNETPMCGIPHHALDTYMGKLLRAGRKVAICDQVEDPAKAKGLVRREVTRVVTPGTVSEPTLLEGKEENLLASLEWDGPAGAGAFLDLSTGQFFVRRWGGAEEAVEDLELFRPREIVAPEGRVLPDELVAWVERSGVCRSELDASLEADARRAAELLERQLGAASLRGFGLEEGEPAARAAAHALAYARQTQRSELEHVRELTVREPDDSLLLDATTLANLEVFTGQRPGRRQATLWSVLDRTVTAGGGRLLREWLRRPLRDGDAIEGRLDAVAALVGEGERRERLRERLGGIPDLERLVGRAVLGSLSPREAAALRDGLQEVPALLADLEGLSAGLLAGVMGVDPVADLAQRLADSLEETPSASVQEGGVIAAGVSDELDRCRSLAQDSKRHILALEARERERTGIGSLKIRYNKVFGYYVEVTKANQHLVPEDYIRKQTLVHAERYVTPEIKELEEQILAAEQRQFALEDELFARLREQVAGQTERLRRLAAATATLDALASHAEVASRNRYTRPRVGPPGGAIRIRDGRHPVVERSAEPRFVPNDVELDGDRAQIVLLTGPNMGGKSTYLRQVALIALMAQAGSFVPAEEAEIGIVDRIFTRVGASDDLARGESTFMVEMIETANILRYATDQSLVILDEVGRGTSTFDGLSLAWAIVEHLHDGRRAKTLFATHYHELTELEAVLPRLVNRTMAVREWEDRIVFLRRVVPGSADKSYGIQVARLAGLPGEVLERAQEVLSNLESQEYDVSGRPKLARGRHTGDPEGSGVSQMTLFAPPEEVVAGILREVDTERLTPLAALNLIESLKSRLAGGGEPEPEPEPEE